MTALRLLGFVVHALDAAGIGHMLTGSHASTFHGEPRATNDVDLVIDPDPAGIDRFTGAVEATGLYCGDGRAALVHRSMFNVIDTTTGAKVDLMLLRDRPFSRSEFGRRQAVTIDEVSLRIATAEDTILAKLEWAGLGSSERQRRDVAGIVAVSGHRLDRAYLRRWAPELGVAEELEAVLGPPESPGDDAAG